MKTLFIQKKRRETRRTLRRLVAICRLRFESGCSRRVIGTGMPRAAFPGTKFVELPTVDEPADAGRRLSSSFATLRAVGMLTTARLPDLPGVDCVVCCAQASNGTVIGRAAQWIPLEGLGPWRKLSRAEVDPLLADLWAANEGANRVHENARVGAGEIEFEESEVADAAV